MKRIKVVFRCSMIENEKNKGSIQMQAATYIEETKDEQK